VVCSCCDFRDAADRQFNAEKAADELQAYRAGRLGPTTRLLRDALVDLGLNHGSLLDIGGGVGPLTFELLDRGMPIATVVEASTAYAAAARAEAVRRGRAEAVTIVQGDAVERAGTLPAADLVTLDRVVCCYPAYAPLLEEAARHAICALALSYPRDRWFVRAAMWLENTRRARQSGFRTYVHPPPAMRRVIEHAGFELARRRTTIMWTIDVFARRQRSSPVGPDASAAERTQPPRV
jgi:magnesium-protoporphyrin O-methyltransferase